MFFYDDFHRHCALVYLRTEHYPEFKAVLNCKLLEHFLMLYHLILECLISEKQTYFICQHNIMLGLPAEMVILCTTKKWNMRYSFRSLSLLLTCMDPHSSGTRNLGKQSFKAANSFRAPYLKDHWAWPYPTFGCSLTPGLKERERKTSDVGSTGPALAPEECEEGRPARDRQWLL